MWEIQQCIIKVNSECLTSFEYIFIQLNKK